MGERISFDTTGHVARIALDRTNKRNAFDLTMLRELAEAYTTFEDRDDLRCAVLCANGDHFTAGLDLAEVGPAVASGAALFPEGLVDPLGLYGRVRSKPVVIAIQGTCLTIGIELALACDVGVASSDARLGQIEIKRGIFPFGGATIRLPARAGWGNAMRWLLTGDTFDAPEALRLGVVQSIVEPGRQIEAAMAIAETIAKQAPLGVRATIESARVADAKGEAAAATALLGQAQVLMASDDAREGLMSFLERREGKFTGK
ncbi:MAG: crotonase/enoyl-CoA hydratase family protein [Myxococcota bacterium]|nr:crotonase/enoyl-CoA hydratase family protein [Myxococcota bacterium]